MQCRIVGALAAVALIHIVLIAAIVSASDAPAPRPVESRTITAQLLNPEPAAAPAAVESAAMPMSVPRAVAEPKQQRPPAKVLQSHPIAPLKPAIAAAPPAHAAAPSEPAQPAPAATNAPTADTPAQAAPPSSAASGHETLSIGAPKSVPHVECRMVKPDYPDLSERRGETGTASVRFVIGVTGAIESVELAKSSGYARLDNAALAAVRASSCQPYLENGVPVRAANTQPFAFTPGD